MLTHVGLNICGLVPVRWRCSILIVFDVTLVVSTSLVELRCALTHIMLSGLVVPCIVDPLDINDLSVVTHILGRAVEALVNRVLHSSHDESVPLKQWDLHVANCRVAET